LNLNALNSSDLSQLHTSNVLTQTNPATHQPLARYSNADKSHVDSAIQAALAARDEWAATPFADRASIFLKAADLLSSRYRYELIAWTIAGQGKNAWQAEIDAAAELCDFWRYAEQFQVASSL
jgi:1-pyrroline-5-carboxylate dehydrogenase